MGDPNEGMILKLGGVDTALRDMLKTPSGTPKFQSDLLWLVSKLTGNDEFVKIWVEEEGIQNVNRCTKKQYAMVACDYVYLTKFTIQIA